jgi:hypothetical protein
MLPPDWGDGYANVWLGTTTEDAERFKLRWPILARIPATIRFISYEPAIGPLGRIDIGERIPNWIICGGERGGHARVMDPAWARHVRDQCIAFDVAYLHKQWGTYRSNPFVQDHGLSLAEAARSDPPTNGKGGAFARRAAASGFSCDGGALKMPRDPKRYRQGDDGLIVEKVGAWADEKIKLVIDYVFAAGGARTKWATTTYIELFCGPGRSLIRDTTRYIDGSAVAAFKRSLDSPCRFTSIYISDLDDELLDTATRRLTALGAPVHPVPGPASTAVTKIVKRLDPRGLHLVFLDPHSLGTLSFDLFVELAKLKNVDIIAHVIISLQDLQRNAGR